MAMRSRSERGSVLEFLPVLMLGLILLLGTIQISLFMLGRHAAELAARQFEAGPAGHAQGIQDSRSSCALAGANAHISTTVLSRSGDASGASVRIRLVPLFNYEPLMGKHAFRSMNLEVRSPPLGIGGSNGKVHD